MAASAPGAEATGSSQPSDTCDRDAPVACLDPEVPSESSTAAEASTSGPSPAEADLIEQAEAHKRQGNELYTCGKYLEATEKYWEAIDVCPETAQQQRAVYHANLAACFLKLERWQEAQEQCSAALRAEPAYVKALMRRADACIKLDNPDQALADARKVLELDPSSSWAQQFVRRWEPVVKERQEKLKEEMVGKLKDLGNTALGWFGLSLDNFKAEQDPSTGSYSIKFQQ